MRAEERLHHESRASHRFSRREILYRLAAPAASLLLGCRGDDSSPAAGEPVQLLETPRKTRLYPLTKPPLSPEVLLEVLGLLSPLDLANYPLGYTLHVMRVWGPAADFPRIRFTRTDLREHWGGRMMEGLENNEVFRLISGNTGGHLLLPSDYGVQVRCGDDGGFGRRYVSTHAGKYVQVMADLGMNIDREIRAADRKAYPLAAAIRDEAMRVTYAGELEWPVSGLSRYVAKPSWSNRFNELISFDMLADELIARGDQGKGACHACHVPYALSTLLNVGEGVLLSSAARDRVRAKLKDFVRKLQTTRRPDGEWGADWDGIARNLGMPLWGAEDLEVISTTGHTLEWMSILSPDLRLPDNVLASAAARLADLLRKNADSRHEWHVHAPYSHAVKSLLGLSGYWLGTDVPNYNLPSNLAASSSASEP